MVKRRTIWIAEIGDEEEGTCYCKKDAEALEHKHKVKEEIYDLENRVFRKYFKKYYSSDDQYDSYINLCVDCGVLISQTERICGIHRSERGMTTTEMSSEVFFDGCRCEKCDQKAYELFGKMARHYDRKNKTLTLIGIRGWAWTYKQDKEEFLLILRLVECWDIAQKMLKKLKKRQKTAKKAVPDN